MRLEQRRRAFVAVERATELPMLILAVAMIPLLVAPVTFDLSDGTERLFLTLDWVIWSAFGLELTVKTYLADERRRYLTSHWVDVVLVLIPFLRPLRVLRSARALRLLRLARVATVLTRAGVSGRIVLGRHGLQYVLAAGLAFVLVGAALVTVIERNADGSIDDLGTALWWAIATVTTVGYGDVVPATAAGRGIGILLMVIGIGVFGVFTANVAALFVEGGDGEGVTNAELLGEIQLLRQQLDALDGDRPLARTREAGRHGDE